MAITADAVRQSRQLTAIIYEAFRRSVFVNVGNRRWESQMSGASKLEFLSLGDEGTVQDRTSAQLQAAITYTTSAATKQTMTRKWFNAFDQLGMEDMRTLAIGGRLESYMAGRLGKKVAIHIDDKIGAIVAGLTYGLVSASGNKNSIVAGSGTDNIARAFPSHPSTAKAITDLIDAIKDAHMLLKEKEAIDGEFEGDAYGSALALVCPVPIARVLVDYLESTGGAAGAGRHRRAGAGQPWDSGYYRLSGFGVRFPRHRGHQRIAEAYRHERLGFVCDPDRREPGRGGHPHRARHRRVRAGQHRRRICASGVPSSGPMLPSL